MNNKVETSIREDTTARHKAKYSNPNIIHQLTLGRFFDQVKLLLGGSSYSKVLEFGCGEGLFLEQLNQRGLKFSELLGVDLRTDAIEEARERCPDYKFEVADLLKSDLGEGSYDLAIASQVLEHLYEPEVYLKRLVQLSGKHLLLTVPWEPWFRLMNFIRGRDILRLGNHPEHVNLWSHRGFKSFVSNHCNVVESKVSFPFTLILAEV